MKPVEELLLDLVSIPSVSSMNNRAVIDYVAASLDPDIWNTHLDSYTDSAGTPKTNLVASTCNTLADRAELALVCHSDTVPYDAAWHEAIHPVIRDGRLYGRGSCDVKGFLACVLVALEGLQSQAFAKPLALIVTADEEVGCLGAKRLAAQETISANSMIIGEPTGLRVVRAGKGYALATVTVRGREAHSAFPARGRSAIYDAARVALALEGVARELENDCDPSFDPPFTTLNVGTIQGGTAKNIVPSECRLLIEWRPIPSQSANYAADLIGRALAVLRQSSPGLDAELEVQRIDPAFVPSKTQRLADLLSSVVNKAPGTIAFGSEAAHLSAMSGETVVFGPGDMTLAHRTGENIPVVDLYQCVAHLKTVIQSLCG